jgi:hypothetical protein
MSVLVGERKQEEEESRGPWKIRSRWEQWEGGDGVSMAAESGRQAQAKAQVPAAPSEGGATPVPATRSGKAGWPQEGTGQAHAAARGMIPLEPFTA